MIRLIILVIIAIAVYFGVNNYDWSGLADKTMTVLQNEKTVKAVTDRRIYDAEQEQKAMLNE